MILTATPHPSTGNEPPYIEVSADAGVNMEFVELTIYRNGVPLRSQPPAIGLRQTYTRDYEAPFGVYSAYTATAVVQPSIEWTTRFEEEWDDFSQWQVVQGSADADSGCLTMSSSGIIVATGALPSTGVWKIEFGPEALWYSPGPRLGSTNWIIFLDSWEFMLYVSAGTGEYYEIPFSPEDPVTIVADTAWTQFKVTHNGVTHNIPTGTIPEFPTMPPTALVSNNNWGFSSVWCDGFTVSEAPDFVDPDPTTVHAETSAYLDEQWPWLIHPANPALSVRIDEPCSWGQCGKTDHLHIDPSTAEEVQSEDRRSLFVPYGRRETVMFPLGRRSMGSWDLVLNATGLQARNRVMTALTDQAPLLLRMPPRYAEMDLPDGWYSVGAAPVRRLTTDDLRNRRRLLTLEMTRTAIPPVPQVPGFTWGAALSRGLTWGDLTDDTWFDLLKGEV